MTLAEFQPNGDITHLAAVVLLPIKLQWSMNASGVSLTTQELYLLVFLTRYLGISVHSVSLYNSAMKFLFVSYTAITIVMLRLQPSLRASCKKCPDPFRPWLHAVIPSLVLTTVIYLWDFGFEMHGFFLFEKFWWTFSELLEPLASIPQLLVLRQCRNAGPMTWCYASLMAVYRAPYIVAWVQATQDKPQWTHHQHLLFYSAMAQTCIYVLFFGTTFADHFFARKHRSCVGSDVFSDRRGDDIEAGFSTAPQGILLRGHSSSSTPSGGAWVAAVTTTAMPHEDQSRDEEEASLHRNFY